MSGRTASISDTGVFFLERHDPVDAFQRREQRARSSWRLIGRSSPLPSMRTDASLFTPTIRHARAPRVGKIGDVAAMQDVEHAVGEHDGRQQRRAQGDEGITGDQLAFEGGGHDGSRTECHGARGGGADKSPPD